MTPRSALALLAFLALSACAGSRPFAPEAADWDARLAALLATEAETAAAWNRADLDGHIAAYADSATFMAPGPVAGRATIRRSLSGFWRDGRPVQDLRYEDLSVRPLGPRHALMTGRYVLSGGGRDERTGWFSLVWEETADGWVILHDHSS